MKHDLTEIAVVLDRSGSMGAIKDKMDEGLWSLIQEQKNVGKECRVSLYQFDDQFEVCFEGTAVDDVKQANCALVPRGRTALNDAVVKSLAAIESRIMMESEEERPEFVVVVVITDGQENASKENTVADARAFISRCTEKYDWKFAFLASDPAGFAEGREMTYGVRGTSVGSYAASSPTMAYSRASASIVSLRCRKGTSVDVSDAAGDTTELREEDVVRSSMTGPWGRRGKGD